MVLLLAKHRAAVAQQSSQMIRIPERGRSELRLPDGFAFH
jgi:hypothetical protein